MVPDLVSSRGESTTSSRFLPWALGGETDWRNAANDWVDGTVMLPFQISSVTMRLPYSSLTLTRICLTPVHCT